MKIEENYSLKEFNTFGIDVKAYSFARFKSVEDLQDLLCQPPFKEEPLILGGGSNVLLTQDQSAVLKNEILGIEKIKEDEDFVYLKVGAGENWHQFVLYCIEKGWGGIENLSLIPGCVGASPMQNIGAYGVEIKEVFESLQAYHMAEREIVSFRLPDCHFGYRDSVFKNKYKGQFILLNVTYRLRKKPKFNTSYGAIPEELEKMGIKTLTLKAVSDAVIRIRSAKLPDPKDLGSAGSFFKNPIVSTKQKEQIEAAYPELKSYPYHDRFKLAAGWLIEKCGWRGYKEKGCGVHQHQSLILVNYGHSTGMDIKRLSEKIQESVYGRFGVKLEREVNVV